MFELNAKIMSAMYILERHRCARSELCFFLSFFFDLGRKAKGSLPRCPAPSFVLFAFHGLPSSSSSLSCTSSSASSFLLILSSWGLETNKTDMQERKGETRRKKRERKREGNRRNAEKRSKDTRSVEFEKASFLDEEEAISTQLKAKQISKRRNAQNSAAVRIKLQQRNRKAYSMKRDMKRQRRRGGFVAEEKRGEPNPKTTHAFFSLESVLAKRKKEKRTKKQDQAC